MPQGTISPLNIRSHNTNNLKVNSFNLIITLSDYDFKWLDQNAGEKYDVPNIVVYICHLTVLGMCFIAYFLLLCKVSLTLYTGHLWHKYKLLLECVLGSFLDWTQLSFVTPQVKYLTLTVLIEGSSLGFW